ncbi:hypothetical protein Syun_024764 [Stephania yunnanensis]|uniref:Uncharacterized protein n=1 Tax=Stephania yunnanensis TaxID=152371 RepID=A0AAP0EZ76_9MAGN
MGVFTFICKSSGVEWTAKQLSGGLEGSASSSFELQRCLVHKALSSDSSGGVQSSFSMITPSSAVFQGVRDKISLWVWETKHQSECGRRSTNFGCGRRSTNFGCNFGCGRRNTGLGVGDEAPVWVWETKHQFWVWRRNTGLGLGDETPVWVWEMMHQFWVWETMHQFWEWETKHHCECGRRSTNFGCGRRSTNPIVRDTLHRFRNQSVDLIDFAICCSISPDRRSAVATTAETPCNHIRDSHSISHSDHSPPLVSDPPAPEIRHRVSRRPDTAAVVAPAGPLPWRALRHILAVLAA